MKKNLWIGITLVILVFVGVVVINLVKKNQEKEINEAYMYVNWAFTGNATRYVQFGANPYTPEGINNYVYLDIAYYRQQTGAEFYYEDVIEYFSQEYEDDGSLRLYNNGLHPEMHTYLDWIHENELAADTYHEIVSEIHETYYQEYLNNGFESSALYTWSRATLDELIKKEADPTYEMDLLSIQMRELAETEGQEVA